MVQKLREKKKKRTKNEKQKIPGDEDNFGFLDDGSSITSADITNTVYSQLLIEITNYNSSY